MIKFAEVFAGAGLMSAGFHQAGFEAVFAAELDKRAVNTYNKNLTPVAECWNALEVREGLSYDVLVAGPPCQGFSTLGKRDPADKRNKLSFAVFEWAQKHRPKVVVIENVKQFVGSVYWNDLHKKFTKAGYECVVWVLNAADFGVAQKRERSFTIFSLIGLPDKPEPVDRKVTVKEAFKGLPSKRCEESHHIWPEPTDLGLDRMKNIPPRGSKRELMANAPHLCPESWFSMGAQATDVWGRMFWNEPANTVRCDFLNPSKGRYLHPTKNRVISLREGARLQGIPDEWRFTGERTSIARQIGNGVPVPLAFAVANSIKCLFQKMH